MRIQRSTSIKSRLLVLVLGALLAVELVSGWTSYLRALHEADELLDTQLVQYAQIMLSLGRDGREDEVRLPEIQAHPYQNKLMFQIWDMRDAPRLMLRSPEAPHHWPDGVAHAGFSETVLDGHAWRFFAVTAADRHLVLAAHDLHIHQELASQIALSNITPLFVAVPLLALLLLLAISHALEPLQALASDLARRAPARLDALPEVNLPTELTPPVRAMNQLFDRIRQTLEHERRFTSDAAHELRTPIAALRAQLQVAERTPDAQERQAAIAKALQGTGRMTHLVGQLLALARLEAESVERPEAAIDLGKLLAEVATGFVAQAAARDVTLQTAIAPGCVVTGNRELLRVLLRNLVDNAVRYVPQAGTVRAALAPEGEMVVLSVDDNGPGVSPEARNLLGQRFHRFGAPGTEGVGLGLSIVQRVAQLHGAAVVFGDGLAGRGLGVSVRFPVCA